MCVVDLRLNGVFGWLAGRAWMRGSRGLGFVFAVWCVMVSGGQAWAVNKCVGADGRVTYTDGPCGAGSEGSRLNTLPPPRPWV